MFRVNNFYKVQKITPKLLEWESRLYLHFSFPTSLEKTKSLVCYIQIVLRFASFSKQRRCVTFEWRVCMFVVSAEVTVVYQNGLPVISVSLPSRRERCQFTLKPISDSVGVFLQQLQAEDRGIDRVAIYSAGNLCLQTNWFTCLLAVCIQPFAFEGKVGCGVSSWTFLKEQKVEMLFLE